MKSNITINIVEPGTGPTPISPSGSIDPVVPNTGLFTHGIGGTEATIIGVAAVVTILAVIIAILYYRNKKQGKIISLKHKKATTIGLASLAIVVSLGTAASLLKLGVSAAEGEETNNNTLTLDVSSEDFTIEVGDEPVFAVLPVDITVAEATEAGYTLTVYAEDTDLVSTTDSSKVIPIVTVDEGELVTLTDNTYGLSLLEPESQVDELYTALSTDSLNPTILKTIDDFSPTTAEDKTTIYYGFYITPDTPYGTHTCSNINYLAEPNHITTLSFNGNGSDGGEAIDARTIAAGDTITLPANTLTREGYHFTGWNTVATPTEQEPGESYADQAEYTADSDQSKNVTLYAQWEEDGPTISDLTDMQDFATLTEEDKASVLNSMTQEQQYQLEDSRDHKVYYISRLKDDNIWMTQNLDFNIVNGGAGLNSTNTDVPANWADAGNLTNTYATGTTTWNWSATVPESYDPGELYWNGELNTNYDGTLDNMTTSTGDSHYHIGNYYNWTAAVAMSDSSAYGDEQFGTDVDQSICPAGWRLSTYSGYKSYDSLVTAQSLSAGTSGNIQSAPTYFVYGGYWGGSSFSVGGDGYYWSSVVDGSDYAYRLYFGVSGDLYPRGNINRDYGYSLRCVAR